MWYKIAKQGSVWSRISPDAEAQFDALLDDATKRSGADRKNYIDIPTLDKLFRKSELKNLIIRFVKLQKNTGYEGAFGRSIFPNIEKLAFFEKLIPSFFANRIYTPAKFNTFEYHSQRSTLKHEMAHAITSHTIPHLEKQEIYLHPGMFSKNEIGKSVRQSNLLILSKNIFMYMFPALRKYLVSKIPRLHDYMDDETIDLNDRLLNLEKLWKEFSDKVRNGQILLDKDGKKMFSRISNDNFENRIKNSKLMMINPSLSLEKVNDVLLKRSQTLYDPEDDLYYANPEETRAHMLEIQYFFSLRLLLEYYDSLVKSKLYDNEIDPKQKYLEDVKKMFNIFLGMKTKWDINNPTRYFSPSAYATYFGLNSTYNSYTTKMFDQKFREQIAKHLNNVYQELKQHMLGSSEPIEETPEKPKLPETPELPETKKEEK